MKLPNAVDAALRGAGPAVPVGPATQTEADSKRGAGVVMSVAFSPDGKTLASVNGGKSVILWDVKTGKNAATLPDTNLVWSVAYSPDGKCLASGTGMLVPRGRSSSGT